MVILTGGVNWYWNRYIRILFDASFVRTDEGPNDGEMGIFRLASNSPSERGRCARRAPRARRRCFTRGSGPSVVGCRCKTFSDRPE